MWLAPGIIVMQAVTIFFPIYEAYKDRSQLRRTLGILQTWEESRRNDEFQSMSNHTSCASDEKRLSGTTEPTRRSEMYTMAALEKALAVNPQPLLHFAATQDFTAENIVFLLQVRRWRADWDRETAHGASITPVAQSRLLDMALDIYTTSVSESTANFPINIEGRIRSALDKVFGHLVSSEPSSHNPAASSDAIDLVTLQSNSIKGISRGLERGSSTDSAETLFGEPSPPTLSTIITTYKEPQSCTQPSRSEIVMIGPGIEKAIFDEAEASIKYLVLTNTWQKLVKAHYNVDLSGTTP